MTVVTCEQNKCRKKFKKDLSFLKKIKNSHFKKYMSILVKTNKLLFPWKKATPLLTSPKPHRSVKLPSPHSHPSPCPHSINLVPYLVLISFVNKS